MFDLYRLDMKGFVSGSPYMILDVSYIDVIADTNAIDTLPVFLIDSICFLGPCLDSSFCSGPWSWREYDEHIKAADTGFRGFDHGIPLRYPDLWLRDGILIPSGYRLHRSTTPPLSLSCADSSVSLLIRARLLDRLSGEELAREVKNVQFLVESKTHRYIIGQETVPAPPAPGSKVWGQVYRATSPWSGWPTLWVGF
jgi:hypothetical protein